MLKYLYTHRCARAPICVSLHMCPAHEEMGWSWQGHSPLLCTGAPQSSRFHRPKGAQWQLNSNGVDLVETCPGRWH